MSFFNNDTRVRRRRKKNTYKTKMRLACELESAIKTAKKIGVGSNLKQAESRKAVRGYDYYSTIVKDNGAYYDGVISVENLENGHRRLIEITIYKRGSWSNLVDHIMNTRNLESSDINITRSGIIVNSDDSNKTVKVTIRYYSREHQNQAIPPFGLAFVGFFRFGGGDYPVEKISSTVNGLPAHSRISASISLIPFRRQVSVYDFMTA